ncbi:kinesin motor domain-containing protein [Artemisia annua]|uniref:Kinesin motor domain-containing protein n=1 Tax=Artemisia annua TaxID=35608 RepID=A0A2U1KT95_ARTAN|nr:kinesin motor domain-containing protein [Artemisia annua]
MKSFTYNDAKVIGSTSFAAQFSRYDEYVSMVDKVVDVVLKKQPSMSKPSVPKIGELEEKVNEMEEELERHHKIRDSLEVELQSLSQRPLTIESFRNISDSDNNIFDQPKDKISRKLHSRYLEQKEAQARIKDLEDERAEQANEVITSCNRSSSVMAADETTDVLGIRYAPPHPTLPEPWKGLTDGST